MYYRNQEGPVVLSLLMKLSKHLVLCLVATTLAVGTATAQTGTDTSSTATSNVNNTRTDDRRGFDYGWLGLIGLAGLLGLRRPAGRDVDALRTGTGRT